MPACGEVEADPDWPLDSGAASSDADTQGADAGGAPPDGASPQHDADGELRQDITEDIDDDRTLDADVLYRVTESIDINAMLTIEPGTRLEFERQADFVVRSDGIFVAEGTEADPIVFTGVDQEPGSWNGLAFRGSEAPENVLGHVIIEYAGRQPLAGNDDAANLTIGGGILRNGLVTVTNAIIRHSAAHGIYMSERGSLSGFEGNLITSNASAPIALPASELGHLDTDSSYGDNGDEVILVAGARIDLDGTWHQLEIPYKMVGNTDIRDAVVTIDAGARLEFDEGAQLTLDSSDAVAIFDGSVTDPIVLTGGEEVPGYWNGLFVRNGHIQGLNHTVIEHGGREALGNGEPANLIVGDNTLRTPEVTVLDSFFRGSAGYGIWVHDAAVVNDGICDANSFENNDLGDCEIEGAD